MVWGKRHQLHSLLETKVLDKESAIVLDLLVKQITEVLISLLLDLMFLPMLIYLELVIGEVHIVKLDMG
jgi:hypothetical protein